MGGSGQFIALQLEADMEQNGKTAIDMEVRFADGSRQRLSDLWKIRPLVLVFLRHLG
jgi:hypothetical protein